MNYFIRNSREVLLENEWFHVYLDNITTKNGFNFPNYYVIDFQKESVATVIQNEKQEILFVNAYRYISDKLSLEIPAGNIEPGEEPFKAAERECLEETGYVVSLQEKSYSYFPSNGSSNQKFQLFFGKLAENQNQKNEIDAAEIKSCLWIDYKKVKEMIMNNQIKDGLSLTALLIYFSLFDLDKTN